MALDLEALVDPGHTALVTQECQRAVMGDLSALPDLAEAAKGEVVANIAQLVEVARAAGVPVIHCTAERRADGFYVDATRCERELEGGFSPARGGRSGWHGLPVAGVIR